jgi:hypothetical protein
MKINEYQLKINQIIVFCSFRSFRSVGQASKPASAGSAKRKQFQFCRPDCERPGLVQQRKQKHKYINEFEGRMGGIRIFENAIALGSLFYYVSRSFVQCMSPFYRSSLDPKPATVYTYLPGSPI